MIPPVHDDRNNRLLTTTDPAGHVTSQTYDNVGNIASKTDGRGKTTSFSYDALNRLTGVTNAKNETTASQLDPNGNCLAQTDGNDHVTIFEYNVRNLPVRRIDHDGRTGTPGSYTYDAAKTESYAYDASGRMTTRIDRMGTETVWTYDARGRILTETVGEDTVSRIWDGNGNLLTLTDATGITTHTYDAMNRLLTKQDPLVGTLSYVYDLTAALPAGHVGERMTDAADHITDTVYDRMGRISQVVTGTHSATYTYTDTACGRVWSTVPVFGRTTPTPWMA